MPKIIDYIYDRSTTTSSPHFAKATAISVLLFYEFVVLMLPDKEGDWDVKTPQTSKRRQVA